MYHITYFECIPIWSISSTSLFLRDKSDVDSFGFVLTVDMAIGSLALLRCFWRVDLSLIFWSILKPFSQNFVVSLLRWCCNSLLFFSSSSQHRSVCSTDGMDRTSNIPPKFNTDEDSSTQTTWSTIRDGHHQLHFKIRIWNKIRTFPYFTRSLHQVHKPD